jgi:hypothetical protein
MASLLGDTVSVTCESCRTSFSVDLWSVVDTEERPDLAARILDASIRYFPCPACGTVRPAADPLLIYRPQQGGVDAAILATSATDTQEATAEGGWLVTWLAAQVGTTAGEIGVIVTPWRLLPAVMQRDIGRDLETPDALLDLRPELGAWYRGALGRLRGYVGLSWVTDLADGDLPELNLTQPFDIPACSRCGQASSGRMPCIVTDHPGLAAGLRDESFFSYVCPHCQAELSLALVFLIWRPRGTPHIFLGVRRGMPSDGVEQRIALLLETLQSQLGDRFREEWTGEMVALPHDALAERLAAPPS